MTPKQKLKKEDVDWKRKKEKVEKMIDEMVKYIVTKILKLDWKTGKRLRK